MIPASLSTSGPLFPLSNNVDLRDEGPKLPTTTQLKLSLHCHYFITSVVSSRPFEIELCSFVFGSVASVVVKRIILQIR